MNEFILDDPSVSVVSVPIENDSKYTQKFAEKSEHRDMIHEMMHKKRILESQINQHF